MNYKIDYERCVKCGLCCDICLVHEKVDGKIETTYPNLCINCGHCSSVCPQNAYHSTENLKTDNQVDYNSLLNVLRNRRSIRKYKKQIIEQHHLEKLFKAAKYAPTGSNAQDVKLIVINDFSKMNDLKNKLLPKTYKLFSYASKIASSPLGNKVLGKKQAKKIKTVYGPAMKVFQKRNDVGEDRLFYNAPAIIIAYGESKDEALDFSTHIALQNIMLAATTLGIGTLLNSFAMMTINMDKEVKSSLGINSNEKSFGVISLGYQNIKFNTDIERNDLDIKYL